MYNKFLRAFFLLLQVLSLFLPFDFINVEAFYKTNLFRKCYSVVWSAVLVLGCAYREWFNAVTLYKTTRPSNIILHILEISSLAAICVISVLSAEFLHKENWGQYLKIQSILKCKLHMKKVNRRRSNVVLEILLGHALLIVIIGVNQYGGAVYDDSSVSLIPRAMNFFVKNVFYYYIFLITCIIHNTILLLRNDFISLKSFLMDSFGSAKYLRSSFLGTNSPNLTFVVGPKALNGLLEATKVLNILFECVDICNKVFGVVILLMSFCTVITILSSFNTTLIMLQEKTLTIEVFINNACDFFIFLIWISFIISSCDLLKEEVDSVTKLCCKLQHSLPHPQACKERMELLSLARRISYGSITISAAGFFDVDLSLIISIFTCVGTYSIALIQFSSMHF
nr:unnamed protein product [Callosobruchus chinensis]